MNGEYYMVIRKGDAWVLYGEQCPTVFTRDQVEKEYLNLLQSFGPENVKALKLVQLKVEVKATLQEEEPVSDADKDALAQGQRDYELQEEKAKTGNLRLDDLVYNGIPFGKQVLVIGPPFIGKETMINSFLLEAMSKDLPVIILTTDCPPTEIIDELKFIYPNVKEYSKKGLLHFIDAYSKSMGLEPGTNLNSKSVDQPSDYKAIGAAITELTEKFKKDGHPVWRMVVRSVSSMIVLTDPVASYKFLQSLTGKAKREKAIIMYLLDRGMHNEQEVQTLSHLMDGSIEFKTDGVKTFLSVQGICDVQSRMWIQYQFSRRGIIIGSFALDHIR